MRDDLRRPGGSGSAETTAFSKERSSGQDGWAAVSSMWSTGTAGAGGLTQGGVLDRRWAEAEIASGISGNEGGGEVWYQDRVRHASPARDTGKEHVRDQPSRKIP